MTQRRHVVYELQGQSLKHARKLMEEIATALALPAMRVNKGQFLAQLKAEKSYILKGCGLLSPAVRVDEKRFALPRAYEEYPAIYTTDGNNPRFFMYSPVDYKGHHFAPKGGKKLSSQEASIIGSGLFAGGWADNYPLVPMKKKGVKTPADFKPDTGPAILRGPFGIAASDATHTFRHYIAGGQTLDTLNDMKRRTQSYQQSIDKVRAYVKTEVEKQFPEILSGLPAGEELYFNESYRDKMAAQAFELDISVRQSGKTDLMKGGQPVELRDCDAFKLVAQPYHDYKIVPRTDTPEGLALIRMIHDIPVKPSPADYPALFANFCHHYSAAEKAAGAKASVAPRVEDWGALSVLVYEIEDFTETGFCPVGSVYIPAEAYHWLKADRTDREIGIDPPPMPENIKKTLGDITSKLSPTTGSPTKSVLAPHP